MSLILSLIAAMSFAALFVYKAWRVHQLRNQLDIIETAFESARDSENSLQTKVSTLSNELRDASLDSVTQLPNWALFEDRLNQAIKEAARHQYTMGLLLIAVYGLKTVNDAMGYESGNALLKEMAVRLQSCIRQVDSVSRMNKDTFAILLPQLSKSEMAALVAERVLAIFEQSFATQQKEVWLTANIGITVYPVDGEQAADLIGHAEYALELARKKGKQTFNFFREQLLVDSQRELALSSGLKYQSVVEELVPYYQPVMDVNKQSIFCMDAFLCWEHPELGLVDSAELAHLAEKQNKANKLSEHLLRYACQQFIHWRSLGFSPQFLSIPITIKQLGSANFIYQISNILKASDFKPEWLILKIASFSDEISVDLVEKAFNMLNYLGIRLAIDDFAASPLPLWSLKVLPVHYLKLGHGLIDDIDVNPQSTKLVKAIIAMGKALSLEIIAQGVETAAQQQVLQEAGCHLMQGRLWSDLLTEDQVKSQMLASE